MTQIINPLLFTHFGTCPAACPACEAEAFLKSKLGDDYAQYAEMRRIAAGLPAQTNEIKLSARVTVLNLRARCHSSLKQHNVIFIGDLVQMSDKELDRCSIGKAFLSEIKQELARFGLHLGMNVPNWPNPEFFPELHEG